MRILSYMPIMPDIVSILSALAEPTRLAAIRLFWDDEEHCVCELMRKIDASQSRMSHHMGVLKVAGLVVDRRDAQWVRYRRNPNLSAKVVAIVEAVIRAFLQTEQAAA